MRTFGTQGPVNSKENYVVSRTEEIADFVNRIKKRQVHRPLRTATDR